MTKIPESLLPLAVPVDELKLHPQNPRRGNLGAIKDSLKQFGQYKPIVANRRTREVLGGNHTFMAVKALGWNEVAVAWVDVDEEEALRILLADNRTAELATYDRVDLGALLATVELDGTGYDEEWVRRYLLSIEAEGLFKGKAEIIADPSVAARITFSDHILLIDDDKFVEWANELRRLPDPVAEMRTRLHLDDALLKPVPKKAAKRSKEPGEAWLDTSIEWLVINDLDLYPGNARKGDIDRLAESLSVNGQFRPITVNRRTMQILTGNNTTRAAKRLGWKKIAATFVDVDEATARKIVLADNRTSDLGSFDHQAVAAVAAQLPDLEGTGYDLFDVALVASTAVTTQKRTASVIAKRDLGGERVSWVVRCDSDAFFAWHDALVETFGHKGIEHEVLRRLGLAP